MSQGIDICYGNQIHCWLVYTIMHVTNALIIKYYLTISVPIMCVHYYNTIQTVNLCTASSRKVGYISKYHI